MCWFHIADFISDHDSENCISFASRYQNAGLFIGQVLKQCDGIFVQKIVPMSPSLKWIFAPNRLEVKRSIKVTDILLQELVKQEILIESNISYIKVSSFMCMYVCVRNVSI